MRSLKISTVSVVFHLTDTVARLSTLALGTYLLSTNLHQGLISTHLNYAVARTAQNKRTFYNKVGLRILSKSRRLLSVNVFATGAIQVAGLKSVQEISQVKRRLCEILNSCTGSIPRHDIIRQTTYGFHLHGDIIYGYPLAAGVVDGRVLRPIGVFSGDGNIIHMHDVEMKRVGVESDEFVYTPVTRRRKNPITGYFDYLGRSVDSRGLPKPRAVRGYSYSYSTTTMSLIPSKLTSKITMMNAGVRFENRRLDLVKLSVDLRSIGLFVSYDPNVYRDINAKFKNNGTALITSTGYVRFYGFRDKPSINKAVERIHSLLRTLSYDL